jgi:hypothetical protein
VPVIAGSDRLDERERQNSLGSELINSCALTIRF